MNWIPFFLGVFAVVAAATGLLLAYVIRKTIVNMWWWKIEEA